MEVRRVLFRSALGTGARSCRPADIYGSYSVTAPYAGQSRGSADDRGNASAGLRSITPCPTLHDPSLIKARGEFNMGHFSVEICALPGSLLSGNQQSITGFIYDPSKAALVPSGNGA